ncbi:unnamed protein product [Colias eurytheme]|nr:unnamed protein product [Colias eurytheme]
MLNTIGFLGILANIALVICQRDIMMTYPTTPTTDFPSTNTAGTFSTQGTFGFRVEDYNGTSSASSSMNQEPICGPDEVPDDCINGGCGRKNCSQLGLPALCVDLIAGYCKKGCRCKENYLRDENGICVPVAQCPTPDCGENKVFDLCPAYCLPDCDVDERLILCQAPPQLGDSDCKPSCRCADNLYRTRDGSCVPKNECPRCGDNAEFVDDVLSICRPQSCAEVGIDLNCGQYNDVIEPGCPHAVETQTPLLVAARFVQRVQITNNKSPVPSFVSSMDVIVGQVMFTTATSRDACCQKTAHPVNKARKLQNMLNLEIPY